MQRAAGVSSIMNRFARTYPGGGTARGSGIARMSRTAAWTSYFRSYFNIESTALGLFFLRDCIAGFLRYYFDILHIEFLWFIPDIFAIVCFAVFIYRCFIVPRNDFGAIVILYTFFSLYLGYMFLESLSGAASSFKMILPVFVGFSFAGRRLEEYPKLLRFIEIVLYVSICGTIANKFVQYPWTGHMSEAFGVTHEAGKLWWSDTEIRLSGFAADSTMAGFFLLLGYVITSIRRGVLWCVVFGVITYIAISATTSKTALGVFVIYGITMAFVRMWPAHRRLSILKFLTTYSFLTLFIPVILIALFSGETLDHSSKSFFSMQDRIDNSWQKPFIYMQHLMPMGYITGCGLGCFNYPQLLFSNKVSYYVPVDNFYIGTYLMFGPIFVIFLVIVIYNVASKYTDVYKLTCIFVMNIYSVTVLNYGPAAALLVLSMSFSDIFVFRRRAGHGDGRNRFGRLYQNNAPLMTDAKPRQSPHST